MPNWPSLGCISLLSWRATAMADASMPKELCVSSAPPDVILAKRLTFIHTHIEPATEIAKALDLRPEQILGLSALESGYGCGRFAEEGNNFFRFMRHRGIR